MGCGETESKECRRVSLASYVSPALSFPLYCAIRTSANIELHWKSKNQRALGLTYDDGPGRRLTRSIVEILAAYDAKANFFLGRRGVEDTETVDIVRAAGHELGVQSFDHRNARKTNAARAVEDINTGYEVAARWVKEDGLFRPPHGKLSCATWCALRKRRARICWWTLDSGDTCSTLPAPKRTVDTIVNKGGGVVLLHDFDRDQDSHAREAFVLQTTELLLKAAHIEGRNVMTMSELFGKNPV